MGCAKTGSGKTAAFVLPVLQRLSEEPYGIFCLVLTPTRCVLDEEPELCQVPTVMLFHLVTRAVVWDVHQGAGLSDCRTVPRAGEASGSERLHHCWWNG